MTVLHRLGANIPAADKALYRALLAWIGFGKLPIALWACQRQRAAFALIDR